MALSFFIKQKQDKTLSLLIDIGSASVGAALVVIEKGKPPHIIANVREDISFQEILSSARFLFSMNHALDKVLRTLQVEIKELNSRGIVASISHVFCTLSSPWFVLKTRNLNITRQKEFEVTAHTLEEFINEDITLLKEDLKETLPLKDIRIIEKKILHIKLNGYEIVNPYKQKTSQIEISTVVGVSSEKVTNSIDQKINRFLHAGPVHFGAFPVVAFSAIRDIFPTEKNFLFLDITGEATDVSLVENDLLVCTVSFPRGKNFIIREISSCMRTVHEEATTLFLMFLRGDLNDAQHTQIAEIVTRAEMEWLTRFEKTTTAFSEKNILPNKIFFTTDTDIVPLFSRLLLKSKHPTGESFNVQYLDQLIVSKFVSFETEVARDPFIVVEALFAEKILKQHN